MASLFREYELLEKSRLFDPAYYLKANPDVDPNQDPLLHYLERGGRERRDPSAAFDTVHYLRQCESLGESPVNALTHYLTVGRERGLTTASTVDRAATARLYVDIPRITDGVASAPVRGGLSIVGWGVADGDERKIEVELNGVRVTSARCGLRRPDVAAVHPALEGALLSGFAAHLPPKILPAGRHRVSLSLVAGGETVRRSEFVIDVQPVPDTRGSWSLRRKVSHAELSFKRLALERLTRERHEAAPWFEVSVSCPRNAAGGESLQRTLLQRTLTSLRRQLYSQWSLRLVGADKCPDVWAALRERIDTGDGTADKTRGRRFVIDLAAGDELGCDALLEFALAAARDDAADLLYCDERRNSPVDGQMEAFFKPAWSPDLLLSTNYLGRAWAADQRLLRRAGLTPGVMRTSGDYAKVLRLTESATNIVHIAKVLHQRAAGAGDDPVEERQALVAALKRRAIKGVVLATTLARHHRVQRHLKRAGERVSIIIPTCAAEGLVRTCIGSLRANTAHTDYEIICVENIPKSRDDARRWLRQHADLVIHADEPFNWSMYNNRGASRADGKYLLFLNDDTEVIDPQWLHALLEHAQRPEVGVVGARLLYPDRSVQHAGVMLDSLGRGRHAFRHLADDDPGYFGLSRMQRNVISVTGACLMTRRQTFDTLGRFDTAHAIINNDLDYCLRSWESGLLNVYTPHACLIHHELVSRSRMPETFDAGKFSTRWSRVIDQGDPYFNANLSRDDESFAVEREPMETVYAGHPLYAHAAVRRILVVKLDHIGDCVTALPAVRRLQHVFPGAAISVLAARSTMPIWQNEPAVVEVIEFNLYQARSGLGKHEIPGSELEKLVSELSAKEFDLAIDLRKQPDSRFVLELTGAALLAGFDHQGRFPWLDIALEWDEDVPLRSKHGHIADDLTALVDRVAAYGDTDRRLMPKVPAAPTALPAATKRRLSAKPLICVHTAAGSEMRQWPLRRFAALIDLLLEDGRYNVALIGGGDETQIGAQVRTHSRRGGDIIDLTGKLELNEVMKVLGASVLFIGNNSGPQHLAAGLGIPTIGIHSGVVDAREWGPLGHAVAVRRDMTCSPCYIERACDCPRQLACLEQLPVASVWSQAEQMLPAAVGSQSRRATVRVAMAASR